jgi:hypothetical protein
MIINFPESSYANSGRIREEIFAKGGRQWGKYGASIRLIGKI